MSMHVSAVYDRRCHSDDKLDFQANDYPVMYQTAKATSEWSSVYYSSS